MTHSFVVIVFNSQRIFSFYFRISFVTRKKMGEQNGTQDKEKATTSWNFSSNNQLLWRLFDSGFIYTHTHIHFSNFTKQALKNGDVSTWKEKRNFVSYQPYKRCVSMYVARERHWCLYKNKIGWNNSERKFVCIFLGGDTQFHSF